ncbi:MAG: GNAT family N-acetyltransferase [Acidobacteria bacterium]|nr:GNAT family N-acetyltransferase [Acidobacteriota bacterium]
MAHEIFDLRHFTSADLRALLTEETELWEKRLGWDYSNSAEMVLRYLDARILPGYAAVQEGRVCGYSFFVYEGGKGILGDLFVTAAVRPGSPGRESLESELLTHVIETLQQSPGIHRIEAQLLPHAAGSLARPFLEAGFHRHVRLFMHVPVNGARLGAGQEAGRSPAGEVEIRLWQEEDFSSAAAVIMAAYRGHVDADINDQYRSTSGSLRFLNNIVRFPGCGVFDPEGSFVAVHRETGLMVGLVLCSRVRSDTGHITQVCLAPDARGRGLGEALLAASYASLQRRRFQALTLTVTEANASAVELYRRMGFTVAHVFDAFVWEG